MVDVRVGQYHVVNRLGVKAQVAVHGIGLQPFALVHAAVEQDALARPGRYQKLAAGHLAGGSDEFDFHNSLQLRVNS